jgi:hypothetical protein
MRRDNVSNLFQTPKLRQNTTTTAQAFPKLDAERPDKTHFFKRNQYSDYTEDLAKYKHTMR